MIAQLVLEELTEVEERFQEQLLSLETGVEQDEGRLGEAEDGSEAIEEKEVEGDEEAAFTELLRELEAHAEECRAAGGTGAVDRMEAELQTLYNAGSDSPRIGELETKLSHIYNGNFDVRFHFDKNRVHRIEKLLEHGYNLGWDRKRPVSLARLEQSLSKLYNAA